MNRVYGPIIQQCTEFVMSFFPSLEENAHRVDVFSNSPRGIEPLMAFHDCLYAERLHTTLNRPTEERAAANLQAIGDENYQRFIQSLRGKHK